MAEETVTNPTETETPNSSTTPTPSTDKPIDKVDLGLGPDDEPKPGEPTPTDDPPKEPEAKGDGEVDERYGAPEGDAGYDIKLEGDIEIDADALAMVTPELKELNLSNTAATKLIGTFAEKVLPHYEEVFTKNLEQSILVQRTEWEGAARDLIAGKDAEGKALVAKNAAGEELSFDGRDMKGVQAVAARALDRLAPQGFREFLNETGLGVHPQMVSLMYQVGKAIAEDGDFETGSVPKKELTREEKFYGPKG